MVVGEGQPLTSEHEVKWIWDHQLFQEDSGPELFLVTLVNDLFGFQVRSSTEIPACWNSKLVTCARSTTGVFLTGETVWDVLSCAVWRKFMNTVLLWVNSVCSPLCIKVIYISQINPPVIEISTYQMSPWQ